MFGWFSAKCPVSTAEKAWTEKRMYWLAEQFGIKRLLNAEVAVPDEHFFPVPYEATREYAKRLMGDIGNRMGIRTDHIKFQVCEDEQMPDQAGHYEPGEETYIRIKKSQLDNPQNLAATLAHELSHEILLGGGLLASDVADHEWVTDLLPVFLGLGIFATNSTVNEVNKRYTNWYLWGIGRQGYLPARVFGYAFALFAFMRGEQKPEWAKHLRLDAAESLRMGLRYLYKTNDTICHVDTIGRPRRPTSEGDLIRELNRGTPSVRLAALWEIRERGISTAEIIEEVAHCLDDRERPDIPRAACEALAALGSVADPVVPELLQALRADNEETRIGAALALGAIGTQANQVVPALGLALEDDTADVVKEAAQALRTYGLQAESVVPFLLNALSKALADCNHMIEELLQTLVACTANPVAKLRERYEARDPELCQFALQELRKQEVA